MPVVQVSPTFDNLFIHRICGFDMHNPVDKDLKSSFHTFKSKMPYQKAFDSKHICIFD